MKYILACFLLVSIQAQGGIETNGGDAVAAEASMRIDHLLSGLSNGILSADEMEILKAMVVLRTQVHIETAETVVLHGVEKDAININIPIPTITISRRAWTRLNDHQKDHLMLHEFLPLSGYDDRDYRLSGVLISKSGVNNTDLRLLMKKLFYCDMRAWLSLNRSDLEIFRPFDLWGLAKANYCSTAIDILINAGWDINDCSRKNQTVLAQVIAEKERGEELDPHNYQQFLGNLLKKGATLSCSPDRK